MVATEERACLSGEHFSKEPPTPTLQEAGRKSTHCNQPPAHGRKPHYIPYNCFSSFELCLVSKADHSLITSQLS